MHTLYSVLFDIVLYSCAGVPFDSVDNDIRRRDVFCAYDMSKMLTILPILYAIRDLKLENFLFMDGTDNTLKLIDFVSCK